jgi:transcriptional regulator of arginine metabolism
VKDRRQRAILELVRQKPVHTQQELAETLAGMGLQATQATVSRDIQELGLVRSSAGYRPAPLVSEAFQENVRSVEAVGDLMIVRTPPGTANFVARAIDEAQFPGVAGTVAGDDTIIVVLRERKAGAALQRMLAGD